MLYASYKNKQAQIVAIHKFSVVFTFCLATLALWLARNDSGGFERFFGALVG